MSLSARAGAKNIFGAFVRLQGYHSNILRLQAKLTPYRRRGIRAITPPGERGVKIGLVKIGRRVNVFGW